MFLFLYSFDCRCIPEYPDFNFYLVDNGFWLVAFLQMTFLFLLITGSLKIDVRLLRGVSLN